MRRLHLSLLTAVALILLTLFFYPKSECGKDFGFGAFDKYRCSCIGFIGRTPVWNSLSIEFDSTIDYSCFGIKIGKTHLVSRNAEFWCSTSGDRLCIYPLDFSLEKGEEEEVSILVQNVNESFSPYTVDIIKGDAYDLDDNKIENTLKFSYDTNVINIGPETPSYLNIAVNKEAVDGNYIFRVVLKNNKNETLDDRMIFIQVT